MPLSLAAPRQTVCVTCLRRFQLLPYILKRSTRKPFMRVVCSYVAAMMGIVAVAAVPCRYSHAETLTLNRGDHICLVGNTLGERMQHQNYWESLLHQRFPEKELVVRNLCFPADEVVTRPRSLNFGTPDEHLAYSKADVVLYFFGYNESFQGAEGLGEFTQDLAKLVVHTQEQNYSGKGNSRVVLISPIAVEDTGDPNIAFDPRRNRLLKQYTDAMRQVARRTKCGFVDLYNPTEQLFQREDQRLTLNSIHLNARGYKALAPILDAGLFGSSSGATTLPELRSAVDDKNFHWWHRYRAVNGFSIYGKRGQAGFDGTYRNQDVMERERNILDEMTANRDQRIWDIAGGKDVAGPVDDSNTTDFIVPKTNVGTEFENKNNDQKRGDLEYLPAEEQLKHFKMAEGYVIELVASEEQFPELVNPIAVNFDAKGRMWVSTMASYPHWQPKTKLDDKLLILEDHNGDGRADECKTFAGGLHQPTGFELGYGGAFIAVQPDILFLKDTDGDDVADVRIRKLVGFDTADSHHGLGAFEWSPGGTLHCMEGIFKYSGIESLDGPVRSEEGAIWAYQPRREHFGIHSYLQITNPWSHAFDDWGNDMITDGTSGNHYYMPPATGHLDFPARHTGGRSDRKNPYKKFLEKVARPSPGGEIVSSSNFPAEAQGDYLVNNVIGLLGIMQYSLQDDGSGLSGKYKHNLVESTYGNFRPVDCQFGPDGALYVCDWQNALIGHLQHNLRDPNRDHSHGRIWRIRYEGNPLAPIKSLADSEANELVQTLKSPIARERYRARRELAAMETDMALSAISGLVESLDASAEPDQHHLMEALWVQQSHNKIDLSLLKSLLGSQDYRARAAATRVLSDCRHLIDNPLELLRSQVVDKHPRVRLEAVRACSFFRTPEAAEIALEAAGMELDHWLEYTLDETMRQLEKF